MNATDIPQPKAGNGFYCFLSRTNLLALSLIFFLSFGIRYYYNFLSPHINDYAAGDAFEYLRNAGALTNLCSQPQSFWLEFCSCLSGSASPEILSHVKQIISPLNGLGLSGPIFPAFLTICYALSGTPFSVGNSAPPVFGQCILSAFTAVCVAATGITAFNRRIGILAGLFCAVYPAFIISTGRLYTEAFAAWLISLICMITVNGMVRKDRTESMFLSLLNGFALGCLQFTRSVMFALSLVLIPITFLQQGWRRGWIYVSCFIVGFALVTVPWMAAQKLLYGSASFILDRAGHFSMLNGNNIETGGWLSFPYPDYSKVMDKPLLAIVAGSFHGSPIYWTKLMLQDKPLRLFEFPCNDFRKPVAGFNFQSQVLLHQLMLLLAAIGAVLAFVAPNESERTKPYSNVIDSEEARHARRCNRIVVLIFLFQILFIHSIYLVANTVNRYNLTAMPLLLLLAAVGAVSVFDLWKKAKSKVPTSLLVISAVLLFVVVRLSPISFVAQFFPHEALDAGVIAQIALRAALVGFFAFCMWRAITILNNDLAANNQKQWCSLSARALLIFIVLGAIPVLIIPAEANGRLGEWQAKLGPGQAINQTVILPQELLKSKNPGQIYLLIDSDSLSSLQDLEVKINGVELDAPIVPSIALCDTFSRFQNLPNGFMRDGEWVFNCMSSQVGISNSELRQWFVLPVPRSLLTTNRIDIEILDSSSNKDSHSNRPVIYGAYSTNRASLPIPALSLYSWEKAFCGVERDDQLSDTRFSTKILADSSVGSEKDLSSEPGLQSGRYNIHLLEAAGPDDGPGKSDAAQAVSEIENQRIGSVTISDQVPYRIYALKPHEKFSHDEWWLLSLKAKIRRTKTPADITVAFKADCSHSKTNSSSADSLSRLWGSEAATKPDVTKSYISPWYYTARNVPVRGDNDWQNLEVAVPIVPGSFGAPLADIICDIQVSPITTQVPTAKAPLTGSTELTDVSLKIHKLPGWPLKPGYKVY